MFRLAALRKAGNALVLTLSMKAVAAPGEYLVGIGLMPDIPDYFVTGESKQ